METRNSSILPASEDPRYLCGSLTYTKAGLFLLFSWLLWGDFCFYLMESIWPNVLPLLLKTQGAPNWLLAFTITTLPNALNFVMNPIISTASDRFRSPMGRRIPFLLGATPFVTAFLILLGFSKEIGKMAYDGLVQTFPDLTLPIVTVGMICVLIACFRFFELFVNTVFWYLFNDVVPSALIGRFLGFFRVVGSLAGGLFNFFLLKHAESHTAALFFGVAILYGTAFTMMSLKVKEGTYPPPDSGLKRSPLDWIRSFFSECLSQRLHRRIFAYSALSGCSNSINAFAVFMALSIGLNLEDVGQVAGTAAFISVILMYPVGALVDRFHPLRVMLAAKIGYCLVMAVKFIFLFHDFSKPTTFWIYAAAAALAIPVSVANTAASLPMMMKLFPHEKFGQFCAANAMCSALGTMIGGFLAGVFLDFVKSASWGGDYAYRFVPVWNVFFMALALGTMVLVFREWTRLGGDRAFRLPIDIP